MPERVPFYSLEPQHHLIRSQVMAAVERVYDRQRFVFGDSLREFEKNYAAFTGVRYCAGVGNGLDAITLSLQALGIGKGDEVIVPSHTFIATWLAVSSVGATIVPVDADPMTCNIDCKQVEAAITSRTKAIIPVHLYGQSCDMDSLMGIAGARGLRVIEDNAQSHGALFNGKKTGSMGHCSAASFYPVKNLGALGDGGAVTAMDKEIFQRVVALRNYGSAEKSVYLMIGTNSRLDELQAAVLNVKLKYLAQWNGERTKIASTYLERFDGLGDLVLPTAAPGCTHVYHRFVVRTSRRDALAAALAKKGVETMIHYPIPPHLQPAYASLGYQTGDFPVAEEISKTCLSLPLWPGMSEDQVKYVADTIRSSW